MTQNDSDDLVSIIMPAFKAESTIRETVASVQQQTYPHWELLIVDDRSPDGTFSLVTLLAQQDPRIRPMRHGVNQGPSAARNTALDAARGRYVAFLDSDDLWLPDKLKSQLKFMRERHAVFSFTGFRRITAGGERTGRYIAIPGSMSYRQFLKDTAIATSTVMIDQIATGPFRMMETHCHDTVLWLELLKRGIPAHGLNHDLMRYRVQPASWSRSKVNQAQWIWWTYRRIERLRLPVAAWCFLHYAWNGWRKYRSF